MKIEDLKFVECTKKLPKNKDKCVVFLKQENKTFVNHMFNDEIENNENFQYFSCINDGSVIYPQKGVFWMLDPDSIETI